MNIFRDAEFLPLRVGGKVSQSDGGDSDVPRVQDGAGFRSGSDGMARAAVDVVAGARCQEDP